MKNTAVVLGFIVVIVVIVVALALVLRGSRSSVGTPIVLRPGLVTIANGHVAISAARVKDGIVLFDAGQDPDGRALKALLHSLDAEPGDVRDVFLTHAHGDHLSGVPLLPRARVWAGQGDVSMAAGVAPPQSVMARIFSWIFMPPAVRVSNPLQGITDIPVGGVGDVRCFPVPGHTRGSYAFLYNRVLFLGDTVTVRNNALGPPFAAFDVEPEANRDSLRALDRDLGDQLVERLCAAHGGCTDSGDGRAAFSAFVKAMTTDAAAPAH
jgi:hydroxyacylglutathione hydrolase